MQQQSSSSSVRLSAVFLHQALPKVFWQAMAEGLWELVGEMRREGIPTP